MGNLIDDILRLSRITRAEMVSAKVDLSEIVRLIASDLMESQPERKVDFIIEPRLIVDGDANLLKVVLENMVGNAWKFTSKKDAARIEFGVIEEKGKKIYFVRDNGAGFDQKYADKLFVAFQGLHSDAEFPGTGIGLATVKRIVHRHGGEVWATGELDKGATFYFTLEGRR
jgi:light-regulated signal transduction histidine kinase (bacteriophytochrome)